MDQEPTSRRHLTRLEKTLAITPPGGPEDRILEMGAYLQITPALETKLGYGEVRGCYFGEAGHTDHKSVTSETGEDVRVRAWIFSMPRKIPFRIRTAIFRRCCAASCWST